MNFLLVVKHRFEVYERRDWKKMKKRKKNGRPLWSVIRVASKEGSDPYMV